MPYTTIKEEAKENTTSSNKIKKHYVRSSVHTASSQHTTMSRQRRAMQQQQSEASVAAMTLGRRSQQLTCGGRRASMMSVRSAYDDDQLEKDIEMLAKSYGIGTLSSSVACCDVTTTKQPLQDLEKNVVFQQSEHVETDDVSLSDLPWGGRWLDFVGNVSIGGLKYAVSPTGSTTRRSVWMFLVVLGFGFMLYQIYERYVYKLRLHALPDLRKVRLQSSVSCSTRSTKGTSMISLCCLQTCKPSRSLHFY